MSKTLAVKVKGQNSGPMAFRSICWWSAPIEPLHCAASHWPVELAHPSSWEAADVWCVIADLSLYLSAFLQLYVEKFDKNKLVVGNSLIIEYNPRLLIQDYRNYVAPTALTHFFFIFKMNFLYHYTSKRCSFTLCVQHPWSFKNIFIMVHWVYYLIKCNNSEVNL